MITFRTGELIKLLHGVPVRFAAIHENHPSGLVTHRLLYNDFLIALKHESPREKVINTGDGGRAENYAESEWLSLMALSRLGLVWVSFTQFDHLQRCP